MRVFVVLSIVFAMSACASSSLSIEDSQPAQHKAASSELKVIERLTGTWAKGQNRLYIHRDQSYHFERERVCNLPPCPIEQTSGSFTLSDAALHFATVEGPPLILSYTLSSDPRRIALTGPKGRQWLLTFVE